MKHILFSYVVEICFHRERGDALAQKERKLPEGVARMAAEWTDLP